MKTYEKIDFRDAPNMPKGFPSELQALAAAEALEPKMKATAREISYGWTVDIADGEGSTGSIVQNGQIHWWPMMQTPRRRPSNSMDSRTATKNAATGV